MEIDAAEGWASLTTILNEPYDPDRFDFSKYHAAGAVLDASMLRSGRLPPNITQIVFSHLHSDHVMDYVRLVHPAWDESGAPIAVYGPAPSCLKARRYGWRTVARSLGSGLSRR